MSEVGTQDSTVPRIEGLEAAAGAWERMGKACVATIQQGAESGDGQICKTAAVVGGFPLNRQVDKHLPHQLYVCFLSTLLMTLAPGRQGHQFQGGHKP